MVRDGCQSRRSGAARSPLLFDPPAVVAWLIEQVRSEFEEDSLDTAKRRERAAIARKREFEADELEGRLVDIHEVTRENQSHVAKLTNELLAISARVPASPEIQKLIHAELVAAINRLAEGDGQ